MDLWYGLNRVLAASRNCACVLSYASRHADVLMTRSLEPEEVYVGNLLDSGLGRS